MSLKVVDTAVKLNSYIQLLHQCRNVCLFFGPSYHLTLAESQLHLLQRGADPIQASLFLISDHLSQWASTLEEALRLFVENTMFKPENVL